jgi:hypothetical protein
MGYIITLSIITVNPISITPKPLQLGQKGLEKNAFMDKACMPGTVIVPCRHSGNFLDYCRLADFQTGRSKPLKPCHASSNVVSRYRYQVTFLPTSPHPFH